ncbi:MAG: alkaline phosphatase D family protein [Chitinophagales bacterium]
MDNNRINQLLLTLLFLFLHVGLYSQKLVSKPFIGHTTRHEINVWCMFKKTAVVYLKIDGQAAKPYLYKKEHSFRKYLPVNAQFDRLSHNHVYHIQYSFDNKDFYPLISAHTTSDSIGDFSFLAGSCAFIGTGFNRAIKPFNSLKIFKTMTNDSTDFMAWLGDNLYYVLQRQNYKAQLKRNIKTRLNKKLSGFLHSRHQYAIWDDHDYGTNNSDGSFKYKESSLTVFQQFWPNPKNDSFNYFTFRQQDCQFFMLDDRYNNEQENIVLGDRQLHWLENELLQSTGTFKFICIGMQALNPLSKKECFYKTADEYKRLIAFIKEHHITGVLFISGDRHHAELMKIKETDLYPLYDFTTSPLTMYPVKIGKKSSEFINPYKLPGTYFPSYNYGKISVTGQAEKRTCRIELKNKRGMVIWSYEIPADELK